jgi:hypothetical protein
MIKVTNLDDFVAQRVISSAHFNDNLHETYNTSGVSTNKSTSLVDFSTSH